MLSGFYTIFSNAVLYQIWKEIFYLIPWFPYFSQLFGGVVESVARYLTPDLYCEQNLWGKQMANVGHSKTIRVHIINTHKHTHSHTHTHTYTHTHTHTHTNTNTHTNKHTHTHTQPHTHTLFHKRTSLYKKIWHFSSRTQPRSLIFHCNWYVYVLSFWYWNVYVVS